MLSQVSTGLIMIIALALLFDFINGFHDTANSIATSVSTRVLTPKAAIVMAAVLNLVGAISSEKVAKTISKGLVYGTIELYVIIAALLAAILWNLITWYLGIPSSSSHALIGGLIGASITYAMSLDKVIWSGVLDKIIIPLFTSPLAGFLAGYILMKFLFKILASTANATVSLWFSKLQIITAALMSYTHGNNDAQKSMGIITLALVSSSIISPDSSIPFWVKVACALSMALGTSMGGWKIIKTMGVNIIKLQPIGGFAAEASSAAVIEIASLFGAPVSTTHVISTSIMGVGSAKRISAVRWSIARNIVWAWVLTIPVTMALGACITLIIKRFY